MKQTTTTSLSDFFQKTNKNGLKTLLPVAINLICITGLLTNPSIAQDNSSAIPHVANAEVVTFNQLDNSGEVTPLAASFIDMGKPTNGYNVITDMTVFNGRLYLATSANPLGSYGTTVFYTTGNSAYTPVLSDASSQGYLRLSVIDNNLYIPDGDPNGYDPSFVYISSTGDASSFTKTNILGAVHSFQVIKYNNKFLVSNGMKSGYGGLCKFDGTSTWNSVFESASTFRLKYSVEFAGKLLVANSANTGGDVDYLLFNGDVETTQPTLQNPSLATGQSFTFRWFASSKNKLFWTVASNGKIRCLVSTDGVNWSAVAVLDGKFVSDYVEFNNKLYALAQDGLWESTDHVNFTKTASIPVSGAFSPVVVSGGNNVEAQASMEVYNGAIWCGSSTNGKLYKVDLGTTSISENQDVKFNLYPNPFTTSLNIQTTKPVHNGSLTILNSLGQVVKTITNLNGTSFTIERDNLSAGIYSVQLRDENTIIASDKVTITE